MECSYYIQNPSVVRGDDATCVFPECFVETVMDDDRNTIDPSTSITPIFNVKDRKMECEVSERLPKTRPFYSRIVLTEPEDEKSEEPPVKIRPVDMLQIEELLPKTHNLKNLFQGVYYKNISKDPFLREICREESVNEQYPFRSTMLNEYLQNNRKLNISFEIPMLYAYDKTQKIAAKTSLPQIINNGSLTIERITMPGPSVKKEEIKQENLQKLRMPFEIKRKTDFDTKKERRESIETKRCYKTPSKCLESLMKLNPKPKPEQVFSDDEKLLMSKFNLSKIPFIYKCKESARGVCCNAPNKFTLCVVLNLGYKRPIAEDVEFKNDKIIDPLSATIAASAVYSRKKFTRLIVPVLPGSDIYKKSKDALKLFNVISYDCKEIKESSEKTISDLVDFVVRQEDFKQTYDYDPDVPEFRETEIEDTETDTCNKEYCLKGCVCDSLKGRVDTKHCDNIDCVFGCVCNELRRRTLRNARFGLTSSFKDEIKEEIIINGKVRRGSKAPQRYKDYVRNFSLVNPMKSLDDKKNNNEFDVPVKKIRLDPAIERKHMPKLLGDSEVPGMEWQVLKPVKEQIIDRRYKFCSGKLKEGQTLGDIFIWCTVHSKYNCLCPNPVTMLKYNLIVWKPTTEARYLANKIMFKIALDTTDGYDKEAVPFDLHVFCSRTYTGPMIDYVLRNRDPIFKKKRQYELDHNILCYSNSYVKGKPYLMLDKTWNVQPLPFDHTEICSKIKVINFHSKDTVDEPEFVDVEELSPIDEDSQDDDSIISIFEKPNEVIDLTDESELNSASPENIKEKLLEKEKTDDEPNTKALPSHGFLCLTPGIGFLEVDNTNNKIRIQHPRTQASCKTFNSIEEANEWINTLFKTHFTFDPPNISLQWVVVTQGILKLKKSKPFPTELFANPSVVITKNGPVINNE